MIGSIAIPTKSPMQMTLYPEWKHNGMPRVCVIRVTITVHRSLTIWLRTRFTCQTQNHLPGPYYSFYAIRTSTVSGVKIMQIQCSPITFKQKPNLKGILRTVCLIQLAFYDLPKCSYTAPNDIVPSTRVFVCPVKILCWCIIIAGYTYLISTGFMLCLGCHDETSTGNPL